MSGVNFDSSGDGGLGYAEEIGDYFLDQILPCIEQRDHDRFTQRQAFRPPDSSIPWFNQEFFDEFFKLVDLFRVQPEGVIVAQRPLRRLMVWFAPPLYRLLGDIVFRRAASES
jgi:hypothetical protein